MITSAGRMPTSTISTSSVRPDDGDFANKFRTFTQEVRFQGTTWNDRLDWLVGGYFADERLRRRDDLGFGSQADLFAGTLIQNAGVPALARFPGYNALNLFSKGFVLNQLDHQPGVRGRAPGLLSNGHWRDCGPGRRHAAQRTRARATSSTRSARITLSSLTTSSRSPTSCRSRLARATRSTRRG